MTQLLRPTEKEWRRMPVFQRDEQFEALRRQLTSTSTRERLQVQRCLVIDTPLAMRLGQYELSLREYIAEGNSVPHDVVPPFKHRSASKRPIFYEVN